MPKEPITITLRDFPHDEVLRGVRVAKIFLDERSDQKAGVRHGVAYGADAEPWKAEMWAYRTKTGIVVRWIAE